MITISDPERWRSGCLDAWSLADCGNLAGAEPQAPRLIERTFRAESKWASHFRSSCGRVIDRSATRFLPRANLPLLCRIRRPPPTRVVEGSESRSETRRG